MFAYELYVVVGGIFAWWSPTVNFSGNCGSHKESPVLLDMCAHYAECGTNAIEDVLELFEVFVFG